MISTEISTPIIVFEPSKCRSTSGSVSDLFMLRSDCVPHRQRSAAEQRGKRTQPCLGATELCSGYHILTVFPCTAAQRVPVRAVASCMDCWSSALLHAPFAQRAMRAEGCEAFLALFVEFIYLLGEKKKKKADIFKKQIVT